MKIFITRLVSEEDGATMVEYALMVALIAVGLIGAVTALKGTVAGVFNGVQGQVDGTGAGN